MVRPPVGKTEGGSSFSSMQKVNFARKFAKNKNIVDLATLSPRHFRLPKISVSISNKISKLFPHLPFVNSDRVSSLLKKLFI